MSRGQVASAGQLDSVVADAVQQPGVRADHPRSGLGADENWLVQAGFADQLPQLSLAGRGLDSTDKLIQGPWVIVLLSSIAVGWVTPVLQGEVSECLIDLVDVKGSRAHVFWIDIITEEAVELEH